MKKIIQFVGEIALELSKVTWLTREETVKLTLMVLITAGVLGGFVGLFDFSFTKLLGLVLAK